MNESQADNSRDLDVVMQFYNLIEYSDNYSKEHMEVCNNTTEMTQMFLKHILNHLNSRQGQQEEPFLMVRQKMLK